MQIIGWIVFGLLAGVVAQLLMPGKGPGVVITRILLGVAGAVIGGYAGSLLDLRRGRFKSFALAVFCSALLLSSIVW